MSTVLVADGDRSRLELVSAILTREGFTVVPLCDGEAALARCADEPPALVLCDAALPGLSGSELCKRVKASSASIRVVVLAEAGEPQALAAESGCDAVLGRPFRFAELSDLLAGWGLAVRKGGRAGGIALAVPAAPPPPDLSKPIVSAAAAAPRACAVAAVPMPIPLPVPGGKPLAIPRLAPPTARPPAPAPLQPPAAPPATVSPSLAPAPPAAAAPSAAIDIAIDIEAESAPELDLDALTVDTAAPPESESAAPSAIVLATEMESRAAPADVEIPVEAAAAPEPAELDIEALLVTDTIRPSPERAAPLQLPEAPAAEPAPPATPSRAMQLEEMLASEYLRLQAADYFTVLDLGPEPSPEEVDGAFAHAVRSLGLSDLPVDSPESLIKRARELNELLRRAHAALRDPGQRKRYREELAAKQAGAAAASTAVVDSEPSAAAAKLYKEGMEKMAKRAYFAARVKFNGAVEKNGGEPSYRVALGRAILLEKQDDELTRRKAMLCIEQALALEPSHVEANLEAARIHLADNARGKARQCLETALRGAPEHPEARELLAKLG